MGLYIGRTSKFLRETLALRQREMAEHLGISVVHYCNIENGKAHPSPELLSRYKDIWEVDLHVLGWSLFGDVSKLPAPVQEAAATISKSWKRELKKKLGHHRQVAD